MVMAKALLGNKVDMDWDLTHRGQGAAILVNSPSGEGPDAGLG